MPFLFKHLHEARLDRRTFLRRMALQGAGLTLAAYGSARLGLWRPLIGQSADTGIGGTITHILTGRAISGALVTVSGATSGTAIGDANGRYHISLTAGTFEVHVVADGYLNTSRGVLDVTDGMETTADFVMLPEDPSPEEQAAIYAKVVQSPEMPSSTGPFPSLAQGEATIAAVAVPDTIWVRLPDPPPDGTVTNMNLDEYLRHVVPAEMPASWPMEALRAQAVAARTYAVKWGATQSNPICTTTGCQVYGGQTYPRSDDAVWSTHGQVATYDNAIITAFYFSRCNGITTKNSEDAIDWQNNCSRLGWNYVAYCRAVPCSGHARSAQSSCGYYGHGVGMCQWGAYDFANAGHDFRWILQHYYTGIMLTRDAPQALAPSNGYLQLASTAPTFRWAGASEQYSVTIVKSTGGTWSSGWVSATSWTPGYTLPAGTYAWYVAGQTAGQPDGQSATRQFTLATTLYTRTISPVTK